MGTRADFYVGRGAEAEWLGSIGWDGYPDGIDEEILGAQTEKDYRAAVEAFFTSRDDVSRPADGWPWPWESSHLTDYSYAFDGAIVYASSFARDWQVAAQYDSEADTEIKSAVFPDMTKVQNVVLGERSGTIVFTDRGEVI